MSSPAPSPRRRRPRRAASAPAPAVEPAALGRALVAAPAVGARVAAAPPGRRALQRQETERLILATALELFLSQGFDATTTKQIADAAGVAHGTVFLVAATKEALLVKVLSEQLRAVVARRAEGVPRRGVVGQLEYVFDGLFAFYAERPQLSRAFLKGIMFFAEPIARAVYDEHVARFAGYLAGLLEAGRARGELAPSVDAEVAASNVLALYVYVVVGLLNAEVPELAVARARFRAGLDALMAGLGPTRAARAGKPRRA